MAGPRGSPRKGANGANRGGGHRGRSRGGIQASSGSGVQARSAAINDAGAGASEADSAGASARTSAGTGAPRKKKLVSELVNAFESEMTAQTKKPAERPAPGRLATSGRQNSAGSLSGSTRGGRPEIARKTSSSSDTASGSPSSPGGGNRGGTTLVIDPVTKKVVRREGSLSPKLTRTVSGGELSLRRQPSSSSLGSPKSTRSRSESITEVDNEGDMARRKVKTAELPRHVEEQTAKDDELMVVGESKVDDVLDGYVLDDKDEPGEPVGVESAADLVAESVAEPEPAEPVEPVEPAEPVVPVGIGSASDPLAEPAAESEPVEPAADLLAEPVESVEPVESAEPTAESDGKRFEPVEAAGEQFEPSSAVDSLHERAGEPVPEAVREPVVRAIPVGVDELATAAAVEQKPAIDPVSDAVPMTDVENPPKSAENSSAVTETIRSQESVKDPIETKSKENFVRVDFGSVAPNIEVTDDANEEAPVEPSSDADAEMTVKKLEPALDVGPREQTKDAQDENPWTADDDKTYDMEGATIATAVSMAVASPVTMVGTPSLTGLSEEAPDPTTGRTFDTVPGPLPTAPETPVSQFELEAPAAAAAAAAAAPVDETPINGATRKHSVDIRGALDAERTERTPEPESLKELATPRPSTTPRSEVIVTPHPIRPREPEDENLIFGVCVVGFHHARGPEVEYWAGPGEDQSQLWPYLPFQSLPDGSHSHEENFSYFTLLYDQDRHIAPDPTPKRDTEGHIIGSDFKNVTTLFGISCNRQIKTEDLKEVTADMTRSTVQKSIVVVARKPIFGPIKEKLTVVTRAYFLQGDFSDRRIIDNLYENLCQIYSFKLDESDLNVGMPLRELIHRLGNKVLMLLKALMSEKRILFFASDTELLCSSQFALVSLVPSLIDHLEDCGSPLLSTYETTLEKPASLKSSDRKSLLKYMGLPLQLFAAGGIFNPYVPLQQIDELSALETKYFLVGSTNSILLSPKNDIADIVVNMDENTVHVHNSSVNSKVGLSGADRRWMDELCQSVQATWDGNDPWRPSDNGYYGSEDYIRVQFEEYIMHLLASVKYDVYLKRAADKPQLMAIRDVRGNPIKEYNMAWVDDWKLSNSYRIFNKFTDPDIFDVVEPRHVANPSAVTTITRQIDERLAQPARDGIKSGVSRMFVLWSGSKDEQPAEKGTTEKINGNGESPLSPATSTRSSSTAKSGGSLPWSKTTNDQDNASVASNASAKSGDTPSSTTTRAGYFSGWGKWASERGRSVFSRRSPGDTGTTTPPAQETDSPAPAA